MINHGHKAFLNFMELIIGKIQSPLLGSNYWAGAMQALVTSKGGKKTQSADTQIRSNNERAIKAFKEMISVIPDGRQTPRSEDFSLYKMPLFKMCL